MLELYHLITLPTRKVIARDLRAEDAEDIAHDTFLAVLEAIQKGDIREPSRILGYARAVVRNMAADGLRQLVQDRSYTTETNSLPDSSVGTQALDDAVLQQEREECLKRALMVLPAHYREVLRRYYFQGQRERLIAQEMHLNAAQVRMLKSRAKARLIAEVRRCLEPRPGAGVGLQQ